MRLDGLDGLSVVFAYPRTGRPGEESPGGDAGWKRSPAPVAARPRRARSATRPPASAALGARVFGLSTQDSEYQREAVERLHLPYPLLSDAGLRLTEALDLPTFEVEGLR